MKNDRLNFPCELALYAAENGISKPVSLFIALKFIYNDYFVIEELDKKQLTQLFCNTDNRTLHKHIKWLINMGWLGQDSKTGAMHIRGWKRILNDLGLENKKSALIYPRHLRSFNALLLSIVVEIKVKKFKFFRERISRGNIKRNRNRNLGKPANYVDGKGSKSYYPSATANQESTRSPITHYGLSNNTLAKIFHKSISWVSTTKKQAKQHEYLAVTKKYSYTELNRDPGIKERLKKAYGEDASRFIVRRDPKCKNKVILREQLHDELESLLTFRYRS